jgi:hypothetical protein
MEIMVSFFFFIQWMICIIFYDKIDLYNIIVKHIT